MTAQAVSKWENGGVPDTELLPAIADFFGVSIDSLFGRELTDYGDLRTALCRNLIDTPVADRFRLIFNYCWDMERALFGKMPEDGAVEDYENMTDGEEQLYSSYMSDDGFTRMGISGRLRYFLLVPDIKDPEAAFFRGIDYVSFFRDFSDPDVFERWNLYRPAWSECRAKDTPFGTGLYLENREPCDCLVLKRMLKEEREKELWLTLYHCRPAGQGIYIELLDGRGHAAVQIILRAGSREDTKDGYLCRMNIRTTTELFYANLDTEKPCMLGLKANCTRYELMLTIRNEEGSETGKVRFLRAAEAIGSIEIRIGSGQGGPNLKDDPEKVQDMERGITEQQTDTASLYVMEAKEGDI